MSRDLAGHGALQPALLVRKWPEPPLLAAKAMAMTEDVMMTTSSRTAGACRHRPLTGCMWGTSDT